MLGFLFVNWLVCYLYVLSGHTFDRFGKFDQPWFPKNLEEFFRQCVIAAFLSTFTGCALFVLANFPW